MSRNTYKASNRLHKNKLTLANGLSIFRPPNKRLAQTEVRNELLICIDLEGVP